MLLALSLSAVCMQAQSGNDDSIQRYAENGKKALAAGQFDVAEKNYEALRKLDPSIAEVHATLGLIYFKEKKFDQAVLEIRKAETLKPGLSQLNTLLSLSLAELGRYSEALPGLEEGFLQSKDPSVQRLCGLQLIRAYTGLQRDSQAVETALQLDKRYPNDAEILYHTSRVYGNFAFLNMQRLRREAPNSVWRHLAASEVYESQGSHNDAIAEYREVLLLEPQRLGVHYRLGRTLLARSRQANAPADIVEARKEFEQELQLDPRNGNAIYELAEIHRNAQELDQAEQLFERALHSYPDFEEAHIGLAAVFMAQQKADEAMVQLQQAIAVNADNEVSWYRLSQVDKSLGHVSEQQKALAQYQRLRQSAREQSARTFDSSASDVTRQELDPAPK